MGPVVSTGPTNRFFECRFLLEFPFGLGREPEEREEAGSSTTPTSDQGRAPGPGRAVGLGLGQGRASIFFTYIFLLEIPNNRKQCLLDHVGVCPLSFSSRCPCLASVMAAAMVVATAAATAGAVAVSYAGTVQANPRPCLTAAEYVSKLQAHETVNLEELNGLRGRLCRGCEPQHFTKLGYGATRFVLGPQALPWRCCVDQGDW